MKWYYKVLIVSSVIAVIVLVLLIAKRQNDIVEKQKLLEDTISQSQVGNTTKSESEFLTKKDLQKFTEDLDFKLKAVKDDLKKNNASQTGTSIIYVQTPGETQTNVGSTSQEKPTEPIPPIDLTNPDPYGYRKGPVKLELTEPFAEKKRVPFGSVTFSVWKEKPWSYKIYPREYQTATILGVDENGRYYAYSKSSIKVDGKKYDLPISKAKLVQELPKSKFRFDPTLYLSVNSGAYFTQPKAAVMPALSIDLFSYGRTKDYPKWSFVGIGAGYEAIDSRLIFIFNPISYNLGEDLPLIKNMYLSPGFGIDLSGQMIIFGGIRVGL
jgi:hypothetical protein